MTAVAKYLYCIIRCGEERAFGDVALIGGDSGSAYTISHQELAVVVSDAGTDQYDITRANMLAHQRVQERVMQELNVLPVRFGTVANGVSPADDIRRLLDRRRQEFERLLSEMEGKVELGFRALWKGEKAVFEEIAAGDNKIRGLRDSLMGKPPQATHFERIRLGEMVKETLERRRRAEASVLLAPLRRIACRAVENPAMGDRMVVNAAFLVEKHREVEFDQAMQRLDREHGQRVIFKYVGPVPPYNFVNIVVSWLDL